MPAVTAARRFSAGALLFLLTTILATTPARPRSFADGPSPGYTGGFDEPTCRQCHIGNELNDPGGALELQVPPAFAPGGAYDITVKLKRPGLERGGFQLAARVAGGPSAGRDAGRFEIEGAAVQANKSADGKVTYVQHTPSGTEAATPGELSWTFRWIAPPEDVTVRFDAAANASNNDDSPLDDYIYAMSKEVRSKK